VNMQMRIAVTRADAAQPGVAAGGASERRRFQAAQEVESDGRSARVTALGGFLEENGNSHGRSCI
jgi:hypothetical protein